MTTSPRNSSVYQNIQEAYANSVKLRFAFLLREQQNSSGDSEYHKDAFGVDYVMNEPNRKKIPHDDLNLFKNEGYHNILSVLKKATREEIDYWSNWYQHANGHVQEIATQYDVPLEVAAAVCAVLSPNLGWKMNLMAARRVMDNWMYKGGADGYKWHDSIPAYKTNVNKAYYILKTGDVAAVNGPKVTVFFQSLLDPDKLERDLVLDGHAINVWRGLKTPLKNLKSPTKNEREAIIYDYRKVADIVGLTPQQVQAVTWFIWKSVKEPPVVKGKFNVEQPEREELNEFFGSAIAASTATNMNRGRTSSFGGSRTGSGGDSVTQTDVDGVLRSIDNRGAQTTAQLAGAVRNKLRVDPKNTKVIASITDMVEKAMKRGKYGTYGESKANLFEMSEDDYKDTVASAEMAHHGQKRRSGEDYITHPKEVSAIVDRLYPGDDLASLVALLHDTLEDAPSLGTVHDTEEMKTFIRGSIGDEQAAEEVIEAVERLTHEPGGDYSSYVQGLLDNKLALRVKLADMLHNLSASPSPKQALKYKGALEALSTAAGNIKPKGISPLHWKLLMKLTSSSTPVVESTVKVNMVVIKEHIRKLVREQLDPDPDAEIKQEVMRVLDLWLKTELSHTLSNLAFDAQENSGAYSISFQDLVDNISSFDLLNLPETGDFFRKNIRNPEALEVYQEESLDKNFYRELDQKIQQAIATTDFTRPTKRRY